ncbi:serine hydrolase [Aquimarina sp. M1]
MKNKTYSTPIHLLSTAFVEHAIQGLKTVLALIIIAMLSTSCAKKEPLQNVLHADTEKIKNVMQNPEKYEVQILYSQIDKNEQDTVVFTDYQFNVSDSTYFYPASTVKFPIAMIALEKLKELQKEGISIDRHTSFILQEDSLYTNIEKEITKIFAVSDNQAYNRLFEFLGQDYINNSLSSKNLKGRISHRLSTDNAHMLKTKPITFINDSDSTANHLQSVIRNRVTPTLILDKITKGNGFIKNDILINHPMDFSEKNFLPLRSLHHMMKRIHFPEVHTKEERFDMAEKDREFLLNAMQTLPSKAGYDKKEYYDGYVKFFMFGDTKEDIPEYIKIYNKVGYAYGYLTDCAYIKDTKNNIEFILSATILVNENGIFNDDTYQYEEIGIPFLAALGRKIYDIEKLRNQ